MTVESILPFIREVDLLKKVERQTNLHNGGRRENSAEHSWHLALAVLAFQEQAAEKIDVFKAVKMALLHDVVEIDAGDTFIYADQSGKVEEEAKAIERITALIPGPLGEEFKRLWYEFESKETPEGRFVGALDRFLPCYANFLNDGEGWRRHGITSAQVRAKNEGPVKAGIPKLWPVLEGMIQAMEKSGGLKTETAL